MARIIADAEECARFDAARLAGLSKINEERPAGSGIGTLSERTLHCVLKYWAQPDEACHEISVGIGKIVADIFDGQRVTEIQTRGFAPLTGKLRRLLEHYPVTVIHPIAVTKRLIWIDPLTGETSPPRKSPRSGNVWDAFAELTRLRELIGHPKLDIKLVMLEVDEYRLKNGWGNGGKKGSTRAERIPVALKEIVTLSDATDYFSLLPPELPSPFTVKHLEQLCGIRRRTAGAVAYSLYNAGYIIREGKAGNAWLYQTADKKPVR